MYPQKVCGLLSTYHLKNSLVPYAGGWYFLNIPRRGGWEVPKESSRAYLPWFFFSSRKNMPSLSACPNTGIFVSACLRDWLSLWVLVVLQVGLCFSVENNDWSKDKPFKPLPFLLSSHPVPAYLVAIFIWKHNSTSITELICIFSERIFKQIFDTTFVWLEKVQGFSLKLKKKQVLVSEFG